MEVHDLGVRVTPRRRFFFLGRHIGLGALVQVVVVVVSTAAVPAVMAATTMMASGMSCAFYHC